MKSFVSRNSLALMIFLGIGGYFLWTEHSAHVALAIPYLPFLLLLACPLLHVFMHGGHGGHAAGGKGADEEARTTGHAGPKPDSSLKQGDRHD